MLTERHITAFLHERSATAVAMFMAIVCTLFAWGAGAVAPVCHAQGWGLPPASAWLPFGLLSAFASLAANLLVALLIVYITRTFNLLRSLTSLVSTMFLVMQIATPALLAQLYGGTILPLLVMAATGILFSIYADRTPQARLNILLIFLLLATASFIQPAFLLFIPVFFIGCVQMRVMGLRGFIAMTLGLIAPAWILLGFGIVNPADISNPFPALLTPPWSPQASDVPFPYIIAAGVTVALGAVFTIANLLKILSYNARTRALNGFFTILLIFTTIFAVVNFSALPFYIPLLNVAAAYQIGHFFTYRRQRRTYIPLLLVAAAYFLLFLWSMP